MIQALRENPFCLMMELNEDLLHHIWKCRLFRVPLKDMDDIPLELLDPGRHNMDSGPDFFTAKIRSEGILWAGNVEIHRKASEWYQHGHHLDPAFDNVILHVVLDPDCRVKNSRGREIRTVRMEFDPGIRFPYKLMMENPGYIPCWRDFYRLEQASRRMWLERLLVERLAERTTRILSGLEQLNGDWNEVLYRSIARAFGQKTNADPFEMLARSVSLSQIREHCPDLLSKEAMLFGQAGFLGSGHTYALSPDSMVQPGSRNMALSASGGPDDNYYRELRISYQGLQGKLELQPMDGFLWKFLRLRPGNFPTIRISQFACCLEKYPPLFDQLMDMDDPADFVMKMDIPASGYWLSHYRFHQKSPEMKKKVGTSRLHGLLINAILPVLFAAQSILGRHKNSPDIPGILALIPPEDNRIIRMWKSLGWEVPDGFSSQALLQLTNKK